MKEEWGGKEAKRDPGYKIWSRKKLSDEDANILDACWEWFEHPPGFIVLIPKMAILRGGTKLTNFESLWMYLWKVAG